MAASIFIGDTEITDCTLSGSVTRRLNRMWSATWRMPIDCATGVTGELVRIYFDSMLWFHGRIMQRSFNTDPNFGYAEYNALDGLEIWQWRPCRDYQTDTPGNFIDPSFLKFYSTGPQIVESLMYASENPAFIPTAAEGDLFMEYGTFEVGGVDLSGAPVNWPMSMLEMATLLTSTGEVDIIATPVDTPGKICRIDVYNGDYGTDRSGEISFDYQGGRNNVMGVRYVEDMAALVNKNQYFFTPRETLRRYKANITGDDPCLIYPPGGATSPPNSPIDNPLGVKRQDSEDTYGVRMAIQEFDVDTIYIEDHPNCVFQDPTRILYRRLWQQESWIRATPRTLVHVTPVRLSDNMQLPPGVDPVQIGDFDIGDLVSVSAGPLVAGGFSGVQRIYGYTVTWDADGIFEIGELQTSADQEGA